MNRTISCCHDSDGLFRLYVTDEETDTTESIAFTKSELAEAMDEIEGALEDAELDEGDAAFESDVSLNEYKRTCTNTRPVILVCSAREKRLAGMADKDLSAFEQACNVFEVVHDRWKWGGVMPPEKSIVSLHQYGGEDEPGIEVLGPPLGRWQLIALKAGIDWYSDEENKQILDEMRAEDEMEAALRSL